ncbi:hypothetical protein [Flavobacterium sp.]|uniref:hypothetical protein n=1 Tax=Flavobacterium sp. TaxID=239 RepID=UPI00286E434D|nr:hypothetical protein [Flavobacterium sp.]
MKEDKYLQASQNLAKAIDIAIESFQKHPPKIWDDKTVRHFINIYLDIKEKSLSPLPQYKNLKSLNYEVNDIFIFFQEGSGDAVNYFWDKIKEHNLPYKRENKLAKILKRKKIKDDIELDFVIDVMVPYQQEGLINEEEVILLNTYIGDFENRVKRK